MILLVIIKFKRATLQSTVNVLDLMLKCRIKKPKPFNLENMLYFRITDLGKTIEGLRKWENIEDARTKKECQRQVSKVKFHHTEIFTEDWMEIPLSQFDKIYCFGPCQIGKWMHLFWCLGCCSLVLNRFFMEFEVLRKNLIKLRTIFEIYSYIQG